MLAQINPRLTALLPPELGGAVLRCTPLPLVPALSLYLLNGDFQQQELSAPAVQRLMEAPLYWVFCWASGQVLAAQLLRHPQYVRGKRVVDFGSGSGVVAIAAAMAGAREVIACDLDPDALAACGENAALNGVSLTLCGDFDAIEGPVEVIPAADVLYDLANLYWLERFLECADDVLVADSRVRDFDFPPYRTLCEAQASTWPDLDESDAFRHVSVYAAFSSTVQAQSRALPSAR
jgi:predicted nicotinamide N-methyase